MPHRCGLTPSMGRSLGIEMGGRVVGSFDQSAGEEPLTGDIGSITRNDWIIVFAQPGGLLSLTDERVQCF